MCEIFVSCHIASCVSALLTLKSFEHFSISTCCFPSFPPNIYLDLDLDRISPKKFLIIIIILINPDFLVLRSHISPWMINYIYPGLQKCEEIKQETCYNMPQVK